MNHASKKPNKLISEKSPYLLQHAYNPVNWYPWSEEAFKKAQSENKPVFLSIGYSSCHWCHVMEKESFEDEEVAALLNDSFISIKVDREERPDIDHVYMAFCQAMTGSGGWPLSIFMTSDKKPFYCGTYFSKHTHFGRIGMIELVQKIKELWVTENKKLLESASEVTVLLEKIDTSFSSSELEASVFNIAFKELENIYDDENGGFGNAPKFPSPHNLLFLLRYFKQTKNIKALEMVEKTLESMCLGGIWDHVGFGFHRYSTDSQWILPHFEKMLYDQAMLLMAFTEAFQLTGKNFYKYIVNKIVTYLKNEMRSNDGGFFSAEDADSEGEEGKFYLWTKKEVEELLQTDAEMFSKTYNIEKDGNFLEESTKQKTRKNVLYLKDRFIESEESRQKLYSFRNKRVHPNKDDKILTDWNGLLIAALSKAAFVFNDDEYKNLAIDACEFILKNLRCQDEKLLHSYRDGKSQVMGNLDDYAFFVWGLLDLYESTYDLKYLKIATILTNDLLQRFSDKEHGGFYFTPHDGEKLVIRKKVFYDGAIPSGNSVAMLNLIRLWKITSNQSFQMYAIELQKAVSNQVANYPLGFTFFLSALDFLFNPNIELIIVGNKESHDTNLMFEMIRKVYFPNKIILLKENQNDLVKIAPYVSAYSCIGGKATVYICKDMKCNEPITESQKITELLL